MIHDLPLSMYKKLTVTFRVGPGCLGPDGIDHIQDFCKFAKKKVDGLDSDFIHWVITPRYDKSLLEAKYKTDNKHLDHDKAEKYLRVFGKELVDFEEHLEDKLSILIDQYIGR
jgi:translation initiation factor 2 alpha subunit (eIF-2alpha)